MKTLFFISLVALVLSQFGCATYDANGVRVFTYEEPKAANQRCSYCRE